MADPIFLDRSPVGGRLDSSSIDATGATLGDVLTVTSDGSGGKIYTPQAAGGGGATELDDLTDVDTTGAASGDVLTFDGTDWGATAPSGGGGGGSGALVLVEQHTVSGAADIQFTTGITSTYDTYEFELQNILPGTTGQTLTMQVSTDGGASWKAGTEYEYSFVNQSTDIAGVGAGGSTVEAYIALCTHTDNAQGYAVNGMVRLHHPLGTAYKKMAEYSITSPVTLGSRRYIWRGSGFWKDTAAVNAVRFLFVSGTITGTIRMYARAKTTGGGGGGGGAMELDDLTDVDTTGAASGDVLTFDGTDWVPQAPGGGGASTFTMYVPGKNATAHAEDDEFDSDSGLWTNANWSEMTTADYNTTVPGALYVKHPVSAVGQKIRAKLKAIPAGDWSKVLDISPPVRFHNGTLACGLIVSTTNDGTSGNQSILGMSQMSGAAISYVSGHSNFGTQNGYQVTNSGWGYGDRVLLRWDRASGVDTVYWGVLNPHHGIIWSAGMGSGSPFYGGIGYYGICYSTINGQEPPVVAFHGIYHFPTSFPATGMRVARNVNYTP
jgi:hypothetical protein